MPAKATKRPLKTDDKRGSDERADKRDNKAAAKRDAVERPVAPSTAVQKAAAQRPATTQPVAAEKSAAAPPAAAAVSGVSTPALEQQLAAAQRQLAELGQHAKAMDDILAERDRRAAGLRNQLAASQAEAERLRSELHTLRETYRCVGRGALAAANQFDAMKRWLPDTLRNVLQRGR